MDVVFDRTFEPHFDVEFKDEPSDSVTEYCYPGAIEGGFVDGVSIEVIPGAGNPWFASFAQGDVSPSATSVVLAMRDGSGILVVSRGNAYLVATNNPHSWEQLKLLPVMGWCVSAGHRLVLLWDFSRVVAYGSSGLAWRTPSISWDGLSDHSIDENRVVFKVWNAPKESYEIASVDLATGTVECGSSPELLNGDDDAT